MNKISMPYYMNGMETLYQENPRKANLEWLRNAQYGMFFHYGLYSVHDCYSIKHMPSWCQYDQKIRLKDYEKLKDRFTAEDFDAEYIARFVKACGAKYINFTTRHHDSFCLWDTAYSDFNSMNSPAKRDLISELYDACKKEGLGLVLYYSHGRDWRHPHAPNNDCWGGAARPQYDPPETSYKYGEEHDLNQYIEFMNHQIAELIEKFPEIIGIWLDGQAVPVSGDLEKFRIQELYDMIHNLSPHMLVSYKQGVTGTEDYFTPEHYIPLGNAKKMNIQEYQKGASRRGKIGDSPDKLIEVCTTMIHDPVAWAYSPFGTHSSAQEVYDKIMDARAQNSNFVMNSGLMGTGKIDPRDETALREAGRMLRLSEAV